MKILFQDSRGVSMAEVLAAIVALSVIAMAVQSLMLVANRFVSDKSAQFQNMENTNDMNNIFCLKFSSAPNAEAHPYYSFYNSSTTITPPSPITYTRQSTSSSRNKAVFGFPLLGKSNVNFTTTHTAAKTFLDGDFKDTSLNKGLVEITDKQHGSSALNSYGNGKNYNSKYYKIHSDSHTLIHFQAVESSADTNRFGTIGKSTDNFIVAARCVNNTSNSSTLGHYIDSRYGQKGSIIDATDKGEFATAEGSEKFVASALYVLEGLKFRPFYFPTASSNFSKIKCCNVDSSVNMFDKSNTTQCKDLNDMTPITYIMTIASEGLHFGSATAKAAGKISASAIGDSSFTGGDSIIDNFLFRELGSDYVTFINNAVTNKPAGMTDRKAKEKEMNRLAAIYYYPKMKEHFSVPITFLKVYELPLIKKNQGSQYASSFIGFHKKNMEDYIQLHFLSVENTCTRRRGLASCSISADSSQQKTNDGSTTLAQFLNVPIPRVCPFTYTNVMDRGSAVFMGTGWMN